MTRTDRVRRTRRTLLAIGALSLAACNGSANRAAPTTEPPITLPRTTSTSTVPTTTAVVSTTSAPNGSPATTTPTTAQPTTTAAPTPEQAVRTAWRGWIEAGEACTIDAQNCDRAALAKFMTGEMLKNKLDNTEALLAKGWRGRLGPGTIDDRYKVVSVTISGQEAVMEFCEYDAGVTYIPGGGPGGADAIVNDESGSRRDKVAFVLEADRAWRVARALSDELQLGKALWDSCIAG